MARKNGVSDKARLVNIECTHGHRFPTQVAALDAPCLVDCKPCGRPYFLTPRLNGRGQLYVNVAGIDGVKVEGGDG